MRSRFVRHARIQAKISTRRDGRVVDGGGLENHCTRKGTGGSNPSPSAKLRSASFGGERRILVHRAARARLPRLGSNPCTPSSFAFARMERHQRPRGSRRDSARIPLPDSKSIETVIRISFLTVRTVIGRHGPPTSHDLKYWSRKDLDRNGFSRKSWRHS